jgi:hypothetical protein
MARNGKIAHLPREIRDELNRRLQDGEQGGSLLAWLNALPSVQAVLARDFGSSAISKQNLCEWRAGGFAEWQARQDTLDDARELAADANEITAATDGKLTDHLATVLAARYAALLAGWNGQVTDEFRRKLRVTHVLCQDIVELCRSGHSGTRLKIEQERLEREREKTEEEVVEHFERWAKNPQVRDWICQTWVDPEERKRRLREIYGRAPETPDEEAIDDQDEKRQRICEIYGLPPEKPTNDDASVNTTEAASGPVKPSQTQSNRIQSNPT